MVGVDTNSVHGVGDQASGERGGGAGDGRVRNGLAEAVYISNTSRRLGALVSVQGRGGFAIGGGVLYRFKTHKQRYRCYC